MKRIILTTIAVAIVASLLVWRAKTPSRPLPKPAMAQAQASTNAPPKPTAAAATSPPVAVGNSAATNLPVQRAVARTARQIGDALLAHAQTLAVRQTPTGQAGTVLRERLVKTDFQYPLLRVVETVTREAAAGVETVTQRDMMVGDHVVVRLRPDVAQADWVAMVQRLGGQVRQQMLTPRLYLVSFAAPTLDTIPNGVAAFGREPQVEFAEPDYLASLASTVPNDTYFGLQWNMQNTGQTVFGQAGIPGADIGMPAAWDISTGSSNIVVGLIDSGVDYTHSELAANIWHNPGEIPGNGIDDDGNGFIDDVIGWNMYAGNNDPYDSNTHGTHCAGTIAAIGNNNNGMAGVCWNVRIMPVEIFPSSGLTTMSVIANAVTYTTLMRVRLTSNSYYSTSSSSALQVAINGAEAEGILFITIAGNDSVNVDSTPRYPASYTNSNIITVGATDNRDAPAGFSDWGPTNVDLFAPGVDIWSCMPTNQYQYMSGTSMAGPHVAGACALLWSVDPTSTAQEIKQAILAGAQPVAALSGLCVTGGRLNVLNAIRRLDPTFNVSLPATASFSGPVGGLFAPATVTYVTSNQATNTISWTATKTAAWLDLSLTNATLAPGQSTNVVVACNTNASTLPFGLYTDTITFSNLTSGAARLRSVQLWACTGETFRQVAAGYYHIVAVERHGTLWAWGDNYYGQLGDGTTVNRLRPVQIGTDTNWQSVTAGYGHTVAIKRDGTLWAWGNNYYGQLGDGTTASMYKYSPAQIGTDTNWQSVTAGFYHTVAVKRDGTLWAWGYNNYGQLGDGTMNNRSSPVQIGTDTNWQSVAAENGHTLAIKTDGTLWACGRNDSGQLGDGTTVNKSSPVQVGTDTNWQSVAAGTSHTVAVERDGTLWAWGANSYRQLGDGTGVSKYSPVQIGTDTNWQSATAGLDHTVAVKRDGTLWAWGYNNYGQLGDGTTVIKPSPVQIGTATNWQSVAAGWDHTVALRNDGVLWDWGYNGYGQLGTGNTSNSSSPTNIVLAAFLTQPHNVVAGAGAIVTFMATAASPTPLSYQWQFNGVNLTDSARISGSQTHSLTLWGNLPTDVGNYQLIIANTYGAITSSVATLTMTVSPTPIITSQPQSLTNLPGTTASFVVTASGTPPLGYQWQFNGTNLTDTLRVAGSQSAFLNITSLLATDAGDYRVIVSNSAGSVTSSVASLTVVLPPQFQPVLATGGNLQFAWNALPGRTYQLQYKSELLQTNWSDLGSPITAVGGTVSTSDAMTNSQGFYRVILLP